MKNRFPAIRNHLFLLTPVLLCIAIMLPRLADPQFGMFDDGYNLGKAVEIAHGNLSMRYDGISGRFRPMYWLTYGILYRLAGLKPLWYFLNNTLILAVIVVALTYWVYLISGKKTRLAWLSGVLFALSVPVIENFYTLGKGEPLQLAFLAGALLTVAFLPRLQRRGYQALLVLGAGLLVFLSAITKETSAVIVPIAGTWLLMDAWANRTTKNADSFTRSLGLFLASVLGEAAYFVARAFMVSVPINGGEYTTRYMPSVQSILASLVRWTGWLIRDDAFLFPLAVLLLAWWCFHRKRVPAGRLYLHMLVWMAGWVIGYLPWSFTQDYYLLPLSLGASVFAALAIDAIFEIQRASALWKGLSLASLGLFAGLFGITLATAVTTAQVQLTVDRANAEMLDNLAATLPRDSTVLINIQDPGEYIPEIQLHLNQVRNRPDLRIENIRPSGIGHVENLQAPFFILTPIIQNSIRLTVRMGVIEESTRIWNNTLPRYLGEHSAQVYQTQHGFRIFNLDLPRVFCPVLKKMSFCAAAQPIIDRRDFLYGWEVYRVPELQVP